MSLPQLIFLASVSLLAGTVDAIAGGGGLLTVPALLAVGLPPHLALGTNKGQSVFGSGAALARFARHGWVDGRRARWTFPAGLLGSLVGASLLLRLRPEPLRPLILALLVGVAFYLALRRLPATEAPRPPVARATLAAVLIACGVGGYDGFFGPGTGTFLIAAFVGVLGLGIARASADAKVVNFASNLAAVLLFAHRGTVLWRVAAPMAATQFLGGLLGAHLAIAGGDVWVRRGVLAVVLLLVLKLGRDVLLGG